MKSYNPKSRIRILSLIKLCMHYAPGNFTACFLITVADGLMAPFMLFTVAKFIDAAITIASPNPRIFSMFLYLGLTALGYLYTQLGQDLRQYGCDLLENKLRNRLKPEVIKKVVSMDYLRFETPAIQDLLLRVTENVEVKFTNLIRTSNGALSISIQTLGVLYAVAVYNWWIALVYIAIIIPTVIMTFQNGRVIYREEKKVAFVTRQMYYLSDILTNREAEHERTLFGFGPAINKRFMETHRFRSNYNTKILARETSGNMAVNIVINVYTVFLLYMLARQIPSQALSVGLFTSIAGSLLSLGKTISTQSSALILDFSTHYEYANDFRTFMLLEEPPAASGSEEESACPRFESLDIRNLWFKYEGSKTYILKGVSLSLTKGRSYSLVGLNGAGKSTLVKIITGLYRGYEGEILLNGRDLSTYSTDALRRIFSVVSQDFAKYAISFRDNIAFGDAQGDISQAVNQLDLHDLVHSLPNGEHSFLGKVYEGGVELSGGEWQRLAIARALYQNTPFMIMDEPTASLSPTAESSMYEQFLEIACDKTLLMITHRLGSTKITDEIIVLDHGRILEKGSHDRLMQNKGIYAQLFGKQSELYDRD